MSFVLIHNALRLVKPVAFAVVLFAVLLLAAYAYNLEMIFRPISPGPATHPLTAIMLACLGLGVYLSWPHRFRMFANIFGMLGLTVAASRCLELIFSITILDTLTPFSVLLATFAKQGQPIVMGGNTATIGVLIGLALLFVQSGHALLAQSLAYMALLISSVGFVGLAYGINKFYGQMALPTIVMSGLLSTAVLLSTARYGILRTLLSPWISGLMARLHLIMVCIAPFAMGYLLLIVADGNPLDSMGIWVILTTLLLNISIVILAKYHEQVDRSRRSNERYLTEAALYDGLTELPNRHYLLDRGEWLMQCYARTQDVLSVLMLDIDHFKVVNDTYGHRTGDEVLKKFAQVVKLSLRQQDLLGRYGGEEFVILLPATGLAGAEQLAEKVRASVAFATFPHAQPLSLSIGCVQVRSGQSLEAAIERADACLYQAKRAGRNRVVSNEMDLIATMPLTANGFSLTGDYNQPALRNRQYNNKLPISTPPTTIG